MDGIRIAVEGCGHGTLHAIYASIEKSCEVKGWSNIDLLIICGDFQAVRNAYDLNCVAMPAKYREMADFHEYYSGQRKAPFLTIFVGGNHEASNHLFELYYGGWVAENMYYMGAANVLQFGSLRIAGMSGIWKGYNYNKLHYERLPYDENDLKSAYHVREIDTRKLLQLSAPIDIGISHDWPRGVEWKGDWRSLFKRKEHLKEDADAGQLGNVAARLVMEHTKPEYWFSGHLHCKYAAIIDHDAVQHKISNDKRPKANRDEIKATNEVTENADEIDLDLDEDLNGTSVSNDNGDQRRPENPDELDLDLEDAAEDKAAIEPVSTTNDSTAVTQDPPSNQEQKHRTTNFLALDKSLPGRDFLQLLEIPVQDSSEVKWPLRLRYDLEWLAITRAFALSEPLILGDPKFNPPRAKSKDEYAGLIEVQKQWLIAQSALDLDIPYDFERTAPVYDGGNIGDPAYSQAAGGLKEYTNPQTSQFCAMLQIPNPFDVPEAQRSERMRAGLKIISEKLHSAQENGGWSGRGPGRGGRDSRGGRGRGRRYRGHRGRG